MERKIVWQQQNNFSENSSLKKAAKRGVQIKRFSGPKGTFYNFFLLFFLPFFAIPLSYFVRTNKFSHFFSFRSDGLEEDGISTRLRLEQTTKDENSSSGKKDCLAIVEQFFRKWFTEENGRFELWKERLFGNSRTIFPKMVH